MSGRYPEIVYTEEGLREGMQIEDANIPIDAKVALLDSTNASFGSNFLGDFPVEAVMKFLEKEHELWDAAGIKVTAVSVGDPMGWCHPVKIEEIFGTLRSNGQILHTSGRTCTTAGAWRSLPCMPPSGRWGPTIRCALRVPLAAWVGVPTAAMAKPLAWRRLRMSCTCWRAWGLTPA